MKRAQHPIWRRRRSGGTSYPRGGKGATAAAGAIRYPRPVWVTVICFALFAYAVMFVVVHPLVDTRLCQWRLWDPLFAIVPRDERWFVITHEVYYVMTAASFVYVAAIAWRGDHRPFLRFGCGLGFMGLLRSLSLLLVPLCRITVEPGTAVLDALPVVEIGPAAIPLRLWAVNDLMFSGHVAEFLILYLVVRDGPRWVPGGLVAWQCVQAYALAATRDHYLIDMLVAVPASFLCVWLADRTLRVLRGSVKI